jgi:hypothetical protein
VSTNEITTAARTSPRDARPPVRSERRAAGFGFRWLLWSPAIAIVLSAVAVPGGLLVFALPLLPLGYFVFALLAQNGLHESREPAVQRTRVPDDIRSRA